MLCLRDRRDRWFELRTHSSSRTRQPEPCSIRRHADHDCGLGGAQPIVCDQQEDLPFAVRELAKRPFEGRRCRTASIADAIASTSSSVTNGLDVARFDGEPMSAGTSPSLLREHSSSDPEQPRQCRVGLWHVSARRLERHEEGVGYEVTDIVWIATSAHAVDRHRSNTGERRPRTTRRRPGPPLPAVRRRLGPPCLAYVVTRRSMSHSRQGVGSSSGDRAQRARDGRTADHREGLSRRLLAWQCARCGARLGTHLAVVRQLRTKSTTFASGPALLASGATAPLASELVGVGEEVRLLRDRQHEQPLLGVQLRGRHVAVELVVASRPQPHRPASNRTRWIERRRRRSGIRMDCRSLPPGRRRPR